MLLALVHLLLSNISRPEVYFILCSDAIMNGASSFFIENIRCNLSQNKIMGNYLGPLDAPYI